MIQFLRNIFKIKKRYVDENGNEEASRLPKRMPADFSVELRFGAGKFIAGRIYTLKTGESTYYNYFGMDEHARCTFMMTEVEMKEVFEALRLNNFDKVEIEENHRLDYHSTTLTGRWGKKFLIQATGQAFSVKPDSIGNFENCVGFVRATGHKKADQLLVLVQLVLDESIHENPGFAIYFSNLSIAGPYPWYNVAKGKPPEHLDLLPGVYLFKCYSYEHINSVITMSTPYLFESYLSVKIPQTKSVALKISKKGHTFLHEVTTTSI